MRFFLLFFALLINNLAYSQTNNTQVKRAIQVSDYDSLISVGKVSISNNGEWIQYSITPQDGDNVLFLESFLGAEKRSFPLAENGKFSYAQKYFTATLVTAKDTIKHLKLKKVKKEDLPKNKLLVHHIAKNETDTFPELKNYKLPEKFDNYFAFWVEPKKDTAKTKSKKKKLKSGTLNVYGENYDSLLFFNHVLNYDFASEEALLWFTTEKVDSAFGSTVKILNLKNKTWQTLDSGAEKYSQVSISRKGNWLAFYSTNDTIKGEELYQLNIFKKGKNGFEKSKQFEKVLQLNEADFVVQPEQSIQFNHNETYLYFTLMDEPFKFDYEKDSTLLEEEKVSVDIWSWHDADIATVQLKNKEKDLNEGVKVGLRLQKGEPYLITKNFEEQVFWPQDLKHPFALLSDNGKYRFSRLYDYQHGTDLYILNLETNQRTLLAEQLKGQYYKPADGNAVAWYNMEDSTWNTYNIKSRKTFSFRHPQQRSFADFYHDRPELAYHSGVVGFSQNDEWFLVYDFNDVFALNTNNGSVKCLTNYQGFKQGLRYKLSNLYADDIAINLNKTQLISAFDLKDKTTFLGAFNSDNSIDIFEEETGKYSVVSVSKNGDKIVFSHQNFNTYPDIFSMDLATGSTRKITNLNNQFKAFKWGVARQISWQSLQGEPIEGMLFLPEGTHREKSLPLMVYFYERNSHTFHNFRTPAPSASIINISHFVSNGYAVFVPDIVYQIGFPGKSSYDCIIPGVQKVLENNLINPEKVAIQGQSWGGYQVAYLVTQTKMFAAAGAGAPVSNMTSAYGGIRWGSGLARAFQYEQGQSRIGASIWESPMRYLENSPLFYADQVKTPLLMMHNDNDGAVPWYQGIEYFVALKRNNAKVWMLNYNGEEHNLMQRKNRKDLSIRLSQFFDHYLKDEPMPIWMQEGIPAKLKGRTLGY
jgi:dienelactone hydrolase